MPTNVTYTSKDFNSIKADLIEYTKSYFPDTYKDFNETSPGMMLIELTSYVGDVLSYYIDYQYKENVLTTATEKRNVRRLAEFLGYKTSNTTPSVVKLKVTTEIGHDSTVERKPNYGHANVVRIPPGLQIKSNINSDLIYETTDDIDFKISGSTADEPEVSPPIVDENGLTTGYTLTRYVRAISGKTKTKSFTLTSPTKFLELDLNEDDVIEILDCTDSSGEKWYEVDYLAQSKILKQTHYTDDDNRGNAYDQGDVASSTSLIPIPYTVEYINTNKKFVTKVDVDTNTTKLMFGNGLYRFNATGSSNTSVFSTVEQAGMTLNGNPIESVGGGLSDLAATNNLNLGEVPTNTILTIQYRVGGGANSNAQVGELTEIQNSSATVTVTNDDPGTGGTDGQTVDEIRNNANAFFASQLRCVTRQDYQARILNLPAKFGNIAKCYVERIDEQGGLFVSTLSYNQNKQLVQTPQLVLTNIMNYLNQFRMINDHLSIGYNLNNGTLFSGYFVNFGVEFVVNADRRFSAAEVKVQVIDTIKDFFKIEKMQFRQSINMNELQYNILGLDGVIGIRTLKLFQQDEGIASGRQLFYYQGNGEVVGNDADYGFQYNFENSLQDGIYRPSITPSVFELRNPNRDIYGKVI